MTITLRQLDGSRVVVEMDVKGRPVVLQGTGQYETRADGNRLHIHVADQDAPLTIVLDESAWTGQIAADSGGGYHVRLNVP